MKIIYPEELLEIDLKEGIPVVLSVEHPHIYAAILANLINQCNGLDGNIRVLDGDAEKKVAKDVCLILNPLVVNCNDRKILSKIYEQLKDNVSEILYEKYMAVNGEIIDFLDSVMMTEQYPIDYSIDIDLIGLFKLFNVHYETTGGTMLERLVDYVKLYHQVCRCDCFVFVGLKAFFTEQELLGFYEACKKDQIYLLLIESQIYSAAGNEMRIVIDKDRCVIG